MAKSLLFGILLSLVIISEVQSRGGGRGGGGRGGGGRGGHSSYGGHSYGRSSHSSGGGFWSSLFGSKSSGSISPAHTYPSSNGLSGTGSKPHSYPPSSGMSGTNNYRPTGGNGHHWSSSHNTYYPGRSYVQAPTYYTSPQYVYINEYRHSDSRYNDILTGLTLYNLGRSNSHYDHHYYHDDYYTRRYGSSSDGSRPYDATEKASCLLKIKENGKVNELKIPCEIVSTFTQDSHAKKVENKTVCTTKTVVVNGTFRSDNSTKYNVSTETIPVETTTEYKSSFPSYSTGFDQDIQRRIDEILNKLNINTDEYKSTLHKVFSPEKNVTEQSTSSNSHNFQMSKGLAQALGVTERSSASSSSTATPATTMPSSTTTAPVSVINVTECTSSATSTNAIDPVKEKGPTINTNGIECTVEIRTHTSLLENRVDCNKLLSYAKLPEPRKELGILPSRQTLKAWATSPPWWLSIFIAA